MSFKSIITLQLKKNNEVALIFSRIYAVFRSFTSIPARIWISIRCFVPISVKIIGIRSIKLGSNTAIGAHSWLNVNGKSSDIKISVGNNCVIGQSNFFTAGHKITIMDYCLTAKNCAFIGSTHLFSNTNAPYISTGTTQCDEIYIGANCFFAYNAQVLGNVSVAHGSIIGANSIVRNDIPPFSLVVGNPGVVVKRFNFFTNEWVKWPTTLPFKEGPSEHDYLEFLNKNTGAILSPISALGGAIYNVF